MASKKMETVRTLLNEVEEIDVEGIVGEEEDSQAGPLRYELFTYPADFTLEVLHQKLNEGEIDVPPMQRQFVWNQNQSSRLIESFLLGLPVPPIFMYAEKSSETLMVVDGQQRLKTIRYFFDGTFGEEVQGKKTVFRLRLSEKSKYNGLSFEELTEQDRRLLKRQVLRAFVMKQVNPQDNSSIFHVFERLNTGGTQLASQEVRNCIYEGPFNLALHKINRIVTWRKIVGREFPDKRLRDVELILRFLALHDEGLTYSKPMKDFLTQYMIKKRMDQRTEEIEKLFTNVSESVFKHLGDRPFHIKAGLNAAVFDSVYVAFARNLENIPKDVKSRYEKLKSDVSYTSLTSGSTTDVDNVKKRVDLAHRYLFGS